MALISLPLCINSYNKRKILNRHTSVHYSWVSAKKSSYSINKHNKQYKWAHTIYIYIYILHTCDNRSEGSIGPSNRQKIQLRVFNDFFILHHSHSLKMCFRKNVCVCVSVRPSPIVEPKPIDRSRSNSISRIL